MSNEYRASLEARFERLSKFPPFVRSAGRLLQEARVAAGLTLAQLAAKAGTNHASISRLENARYKSVSDLLSRCVSALGLDFERFFDAAFLSMDEDDQYAADHFVPPPLTRGPHKPNDRDQLSAGSPSGSPGAKAFMSSARALSNALEAAGVKVTAAEFVDLLEKVVDDNPMDHTLNAVLAAISTLTRTKS
jgi:transcriptional regulator with XRE-family HTH domain